MSGQRFTIEWLERHRVDVTGVTEADVVGIGHVTTEIRSLVGRLGNPEVLAEIGGTLPRGIILFGAPGTGKTLTARLLASMVGRLSRPVRFYELSADELEPGLIRGMFRHLASADEAVIVYLDEIDLIATHRSSRLQDAGGRKALTALLAGLDGLRDAGHVVVVASTNAHPTSLDPALVRPGRLGQWVHVSHPERAELADLWRHFLGRIRMADTFDADLLAERVEGETPARIRGYVEDAVGIALAAGHTAVSSADLELALQRTGRVEPPVESPPPSLRAAIHEAGHVSVAIALLGSHAVERVTLDDGWGETRVQHDDRALTWSGVEHLVAVAFGGGEAERLLLGESSMGSEHDVEHVTALVVDAIDAGLHPALPPMNSKVLKAVLSDRHRTSLTSEVAVAVEAGRALARALIATQELEIGRFADLMREARALKGEALRIALMEAGFDHERGAAPALAQFRQDLNGDRGEQRPVAARSKA